MLYRSIFTGILISIALTGCASLSEKYEIVKSKPIEKNLLSGREGPNGSLLVVKIDDTNQAHPQVGLDAADVIYIEQVEGGLTRLAAVFSSIIPKRIGPVRSARISDIDILSQYGRVAFAYSGAQKKLLSEIAGANLLNLGAQSQPPSIYTTDPSRNSPFSMILRADLLMQKILDKGYSVDSAHSVGWNFGASPDQGAPISRVVIHWPAATYSATWSESENRWLLTHNNKENLTETGFRLGASTLVIQIADISASQYKDKFGAVTPITKTIGSGTGYVLRNGKSFSATWSRLKPEDGTTWKSLSGSEILFAPGQIWVALTDIEPNFTLMTPSPDPSLTK